MVNGSLSQPGADQAGRLARVGLRMLGPENHPSIEELRGAAMRRLFPKRCGGRAHAPESAVAQRVYAYLAGATSTEDLERRSRFPRELMEAVRLRDGRSVLVRPVLPTDASMHRAFVRAMSTATRRNRFHGGVADLPDSALRYLTEVDYVDHLALVGEAADEAGARQVAEARWVRRGDEPDHADFAIAIADDYQLGGLGNRLLDLLERSAAAKGIARLCGHVLRDNRRMIGWLEARGWTTERDPHDPGVVCVERALRALAPRAWRQAA